MLAAAILAFVEAAHVPGAAYLEPDTDNWHGMWKGVDRPTMRYELLGQTRESTTESMHRTDKMQSLVTW